MVESTKNAKKFWRVITEQLAGECRVVDPSVLEKLKKASKKAKSIADQKTVSTVAALLGVFIKKVDAPIFEGGVRDGSRYFINGTTVYPSPDDESSSDDSGSGSEASDEEKTGECTNFHSIHGEYMEGTLSLATAASSIIEVCTAQLSPPLTKWFSRVNMENENIIPIICILGNITAGKSSTLRNLQRWADHARSPYRIMTIEECLPQFSDFNGHNPLALFYKDPMRNAAITQAYICDVIQGVFKEKMQDIPRDEKIVIVTDRSLYATAVFSKAMYVRGYMNEFSYEYLVEKTHKQALDIIQTTKVRYAGALHLKAPANVLLQRVGERDRPFETDMISLGYLKDLNEAYDQHMDWWKSHLSGEEFMLEIDTAENAQEQVVEKLKDLIDCVMKENVQ